MYGFILNFNITGGELKTLIYRLAKNKQIWDLKLLSEMFTSWSTETLD